MNRYLLDTNIVSELIRIKPDPNVLSWFSSVDESSLYLSVLTIGEICKGLNSLANTKKRLALEEWYIELKLRFSGKIIEVNERVAEEWGIISSAGKRQGKQLSVIDGLLAATAIIYGLTLVTRNVGDFELDKLSVLNPWD